MGHPQAHKTSCPILELTKPSVLCPFPRQGGKQVKGCRISHHTPQSVSCAGRSRPEPISIVIHPWLVLPDTRTRTLDPPCTQPNNSGVRTQQGQAKHHISRHASEKRPKLPALCHEVAKPLCHAKPVLFIALRWANVHSFHVLSHTHRESETASCFACTSAGIATQRRDMALRRGYP